MSRGRPATPRSGASDARSSQRFLLLAATSYLLNLLVTAGLHEGAGAPEEVAFAAALLTVFVVNFSGLRWYVFDVSHRRLLPQLLGFALSSLAFRTIEFAVFVLLHRLGGVPYLVAAALTLGSSFFAKYAFYGSWLFGSRSGASARRPR